MLHSTVDIWWEDHAEGSEACWALCYGVPVYGSRWIWFPRIYFIILQKQQDEFWSVILSSHIKLNASKQIGRRFAVQSLWGQRSGLYCMCQVRPRTRTQRPSWSKTALKRIRPSMDSTLQDWKTKSLLYSLLCPTAFGAFRREDFVHSFLQCLHLFPWFECK